VVHGAVRTLFQVLGSLAMLLAIGIPLFAWRLASAPIELGWLSPYIEEALSARDGAFMVRLERTVLAWDSEEKLLEVRAQEVRAIVDGRTIASVPEMSVTLSGLRLLRGELSPRALRLLRPRLVVVRNLDGSFELGFGDSRPGDRQRTLEAVWKRITDPAPGALEAELASIAVVDADLSFEDLGAKTRWNFPDVDLRATRQGQEVQLDASVLASFGDDKATFTASTRLSGETKVIPVAFGIRGFKPSSLGAFLPDQPAAKIFDMTISGSGHASVTLDGRVETLGFDLQAGPGSLRLPSPVKGNIAVSSVRATGKAMDDFRQISLDELRVDLGGAVLTAGARLEPRGSAILVSGQVGVADMPITRLKEFWPAELAPMPRAWIVANIVNGMIRKTQAEFAAQVDGLDMAGLRVGSIRTVLDVTDATVRYFGPMPLATGVRGQVSVDQDKVAIRIDAGKSAGMAIPEGTVVISGLDKPDQIADIQLKVTGTVADALRLLDNKPLGYATKLGLKPEMLGGTHVSAIKLRVPLVRDVLLTDLGVGAQADVYGLTVPAVLKDLDLTDGNLKLQVDTKSLEAAGMAKLGGIPARLKWNETFSGPGTRRMYQVSAELDEKARKLLGLGDAPFVAPYLSGPIIADATIAYGEGDRAQLDARLDLAKARLELPGSGWEKVPGRPASATVKVLLDKQGITAVPDFLVRAEDFTLHGKVAMEEGRASRVEIDRLAHGRTDIALLVHLEPGGGSSVSLSGKSIDAVPLLKESKDRTPPDESLPALTVSGQVDRVWVSAEGALTATSLDLRRDRGTWNEVKVAGFAGAKPLQVQIQPESSGNRRLLIASEDAAGVLRTFGVYDHMRGGRLEIRGLFEDRKPGRPLQGTALIQDYSVTNAPTLARLLTIAALTGILDLLRGEGVSFSSLEAPFTLKDGLLELKDARAFGPALGITANGQLDLDHEKIAVEGTIVPAYAINSLIGDIPLIGRLLTGDKGSGVFAATYTARGALEEPDVSVNPLATLAPGFLRKFFQIFTPDSTKARPEAGAGDSSRDSVPAPERID
jgi:hypothetical protein